MAAIIISRRIRRSLRRQRVFRDRRNPLDSFSDGELYEAFRFHRTDLLRLFDDLADEIEYVAPRQGSLPVPMQVLLMFNFVCCASMCICCTTPTLPLDGYLRVLSARHHTHLVTSCGYFIEHRCCKQTRLASIITSINVLIY